MRITDPALAVREHGVDWLSTLMDGLEGYDGSLYREWKLVHEPQQTSDDGDDSQPRLSYHAYTQDTMLLNLIFSRIEMLCQAQLRDKNGNPVIDPIWFQPPGVETRPQEATYESMLAFLSS